MPPIVPEQEKSGEDKDAVEKSCHKLEKIINELASKSKYERTVLPNGDVELISRSSEKEKFTLHQITDPDDPAVVELIKLLKQKIDPDEVDTIETIQTAIRTNWGIYFIMKNKTEEVIAHTNSSLLDLESGDKKEGIHYMSYAVTREQDEGKGLAREMYTDMHRYALEKARKEGIFIKGIISESDAGVEDFVYKLDGQKRIYFEDKEGNVHEVPYECGPHDWDKDTGESLMESAPEHLMLRLLDGRQELSIQEMMQMVRTLYKGNYIFEKEFFNSDKAYRRNLEVVEEFMKNLEETLNKSKDGRLFFMSSQEREQKKTTLEAQGKKMYEVTYGEDEN